MTRPRSRSGRRPASRRRCRSRPMRRKAFRSSWSGGTCRGRPLPAACTTRSGMRSWSKCMIFSRRWKSSNRVGPRSPTRRLLSVSSTGTPVAVVRVSPPWAHWGATASSGAPAETVALRRAEVGAAFDGGFATRRTFRRGADRLKHHARRISRFGSAHAQSQVPDSAPHKPGQRIWSRPCTSRRCARLASSASSRVSKVPSSP